jgi:DNA (cytosine-5)-methyltransferase 1
MTTDITVGSLFAGYDGVGIAVNAIWPGARSTWFSEFDAAPSKVLAHHWPDVPNLGDITKIDWSSVPRVDIMTGGFPCQDLSHAGKGAGLMSGTRSGLWENFAVAIQELRPALVVIENVRGLLSAKTADSESVPVTGPKGGRKMGLTRRALGRVLWDLAELGYDASWTSVRASDAGAPHQRFRVFILAWAVDDPSHAHDARLEGRALPGERARELAAWASRVGPGGPGSHDLSLLPTPTVSDANGAGTHGDGGADLRTAVSLLPTPAVNDMGAGKTVESWDSWTERMKAEHSNGNGHGKSLAIEALRVAALDSEVKLLPTPVVTDSIGARNATSTRPEGSKHHAGTTLTDVVWQEFDGSPESAIPAPPETPPSCGCALWGMYGPAIHRWELVLGRVAPPPTEPGKEGKPRLSPRAVEWMMGLPEFHVTDPKLKLTRAQQLKLCGNGVVPAQAEKALRQLVQTVGAEFPGAEMTPEAAPAELDTVSAGAAEVPAAPGRKFASNAEVRGLAALEVLEPARYQAALAAICADNPLVWNRLASFGAEHDLVIQGLELLQELEPARAEKAVAVLRAGHLARARLLEYLETHRQS